MIFKIITYSKWKRFWGKENTLLQSLFQSVKDKIDAIVIPDPDLSAVAKEANATANKEAIISAVNSAQPDLTAVAKEAQATLNKEAIMAAMPSVPTVQQIQSGLATESNATSNKEAIIAAMSEISVDTSNLATKAVEQWLGLEESYEAEAKGGERTNNTVIDECKVRFQDAFNGLLPTGFTMPNSVTVDNLTYTGTTNS